MEITNDDVWHSYKFPPLFQNAFQTLTGKECTMKSTTSAHPTSSLLYPRDPSTLTESPNTSPRPLFCEEPLLQMQKPKQSDQLNQFEKNTLPHLAAISCSGETSKRVPEHARTRQHSSVAFIPGHVSGESLKAEETSTEKLTVSSSNNIPESGVIMSSKKTMHFNENKSPFIQKDLVEHSTIGNVTGMTRSLIQLFPHDEPPSHVSRGSETFSDLSFYHGTTQPKSGSFRKNSLGSYQNMPSYVSFGCKSGLSDAPFNQLQLKKRQSIASMNMRRSQASHLGIHEVTHSTNPMLQRILSRDSKKRRVKKDAPSFLSVELPVFDVESGSLGKELIFPRSLKVEEAVEQVLSQECGEIRTKTAGLGISRFLTDFSESREIIFLYFWYVVAHMRRVDAEKMLIGRYFNLERVVRTAFPNYKGEMPPVSLLEQKLAEAVHFLTTEKQDAKIQNLGVGDSFRLSITEKGSEQSLCHNSSFRRKALCSRTFSFLSSRGIKSRLSQDPKRMPDENLSFDKTQPHDLAVFMRCAEAVDVFSLVLVEAYELADFAHCCFQRLATLFGAAFERLEEEKDEVFSGFIILVPHVVYYVMLNSFSNDVIAGYFNREMRQNLYRIFYFWCSGIVVTYVHVNRWPRPKINHSYSKTNNNNAEASTTKSEANAYHDAYGVSCPLEEEEEEEVMVGMTTEKVKREKSHATNIDKEIETVIDLTPASCSHKCDSSSVSLAFQTIPLDENLKPLEGKSFDDVDVQVANGHYFLVEEFQRYAKHVNYLLQNLEQHTTRTYRRISQQHLLRREKNTRETHFLIPDEKANVCSVPTGSNTHHSSGNARSNASLHPTHGFSKRRPKNQKNIRSSTQKNSLSTSVRFSNPTGVCMLSDFPLNRETAHLQQYVIEHAEGMFPQVPLPPLISDTCESSAHVKNKLPPLKVQPQQLQEETQYNSIMRTVKFTLPVFSPFYLQYRNTKSKSLVVDPNASLSTFSLTQQPSMSFPSNKNRQTHLSIGCTTLSESPKREMHSVPRGETRILPHGVERPINVMLIPSSDTRMRPLRFKALTREVTKQKMKIDRQLDELVAHEQQRRRRYDVESRYGFHRVLQLLVNSSLKPMQQQFRMKTKKAYNHRNDV